MNELIESPSGQVYLNDLTCRVRYGIDGSPWAAGNVAGWRVVGYAPTLFAWQEDPGRYGPAHVLARLTRTVGTEAESFTAGGNVIYVKAWAADYGFTVVLLASYVNRNLARAAAQVQW